jgi:hypothetical protein
MPAIFVQGQGWVQGKTEIHHQNIEFHNQTFSINLPSSFILESPRNTEGFPIPFIDRIEIEFDCHVLHPKSLRDVNWEWHFKYHASNRDVRYSTQPAKGKVKTQDNGKFLVELDTPNFSHPQICQITLQATHPSQERSIVSNSVRYQRTGIRVEALTEWNKLEPNANDNIEISFKFSNPFPKPKTILIKCPDEEKKIVLDSKEVTQHNFALPAPLPKGFIVSSDDGINIFSKDNGLMGFQSSIGVNLTQPSNRPKILNVDTGIEDGRQRVEITLDCPADYLDSTQTTPLAKVSKSTTTHRRDRYNVWGQWLELEFQESNCEKLYFITEEPLEKGIYRLRLGATMPDGVKVSLNKDSFLIKDGTVYYLSKKISTAQVNDHIEVHIEIELESTIPNDFEICFNPKYLPLSSGRCSFFSGEKHIVKRGITNHQISLAIPLYSEKNMKFIDTSLSIIPQVMGESIDLLPIDVNLVNQEDISCFRMHAPDWTDENHFKTQKDIEEKLKIDRKGLKYDFCFDASLARRYRPDLPPSNMLKSVKILYDRYGGEEAMKFILPQDLDLQEHSHFFKKREHIAKMINMSQELETLSAENRYFLRINAVSDDLYDPLEVFTHARFLIDNKHIFSGEFSALMNQDFHPRISDYQKHRYELKNVGEKLGLETKYVIPDEAFDLNGAGEESTTDDDLRDHTLFDFIMQRKEISEQLETFLIKLENLIGNDQEE